MLDHHPPLVVAERAANTSQPIAIDEQRHSLPMLLKCPRYKLNHRLQLNISYVERSMSLLIDQARPSSLRSFDQIAMHPHDHARQIKLMAPYLADQAVAFMGDSDCASLLLGLIGAYIGLQPSRMLLLDFDERLLDVARRFADKQGFGHLLETRLYNVFDALPTDLVGQFDWFYTNPPYGSHNSGDSARLFITRGCEIAQAHGQGCIILPHDSERSWTGAAMLATQRFLCDHGWVTREKVCKLHRYRLDDDRHLTSSLMLVEHAADSVTLSMPYAGRRVAFDEIPLFYGRNVLPPYPRYIRSNGEQDFTWIEAKVGHHG